MVAIFPPPFSPLTPSTASASVAPAMYREEKSCTTGFGTAGRRRTMAESSSVTGGRLYAGRLVRGVPGSVLVRPGAEWAVLRHRRAWHYLRAGPAHGPRD